MRQNSELLRGSLVNLMLQSEVILLKSMSPDGQGFKLKLHEKEPDAPLSPIYVDLRRLRSALGAKAQAVSAYRSMILDVQEENEVSFDYFADLPTSATPVVSSLSDRMEIPQITPRNDKKAHGSGAKIDGLFSAGGSVAVIDDLITNGNSKIEFVETLRAAGLICQHVFVLVDREQGGEALLEQHGLTLHAFMTLREMLGIAHQQQIISTEDYDAVIDYLNLG